MAAQRSERLVNLVIALLVTDRPLTRAQLRDMIEDYRKVSEVAFQRSFERDKEELRRIGITVESVTLDTFFGDECMSASVKGLLGDDTFFGDECISSCEEDRI